MSTGQSPEREFSEKFPYLLFDADDTLFDFPIGVALNGVPDTLDTRALYHRINQELRAAFDRGEVSKDYVTLERFVRFFQALKLPRDPDKCNRDYLTALGAGVYPLPHAQEVTGSVSMSPKKIPCKVLLCFELKPHNPPLIYSR